MEMARRIEPGPGTEAPRRSGARARMRRILNQNPRRWVLFLAGLEGMAFLVLGYEWGPALPGARLLILLVLCAASPLVSVLLMFAHSRLLCWSGRLLRGQARPYEIHAAQAWASVPILAAAALRLPFLRLPNGAFLGSRLVPAGPWESLAPVVEIVAGVLGIWSFSLFLSYLAEAQRFSRWRAFLNVVLSAILAVAIPLAAVLLHSLIHPHR